ncbi:hypothetical protein EJB05_46230 [Eragrostis curvula]|uniref:Uncharacterized protein n=1 Tax=Eragrostis curvula TaxID=38414 RepID=A0A5J9TMF2_9POAL|nr:hypothetical protein EJB05_46230 [Eragrostis curvula]
MEPASSIPPAVAVDVPAAAPAPPTPAAPAAAAPAALAVLAVPRARAPPALVASRATVVKALFVLGCAAAALALFGMTMNPADSAGFLGSCAPTAEEIADLRGASKKLLLAAATQVFGATLAAVAPAPPLAVSAAGLGLVTGVHLYSFFPALLMCHLNGTATIISYVAFVVVMWLTLGVSCAMAVIGDLYL